jgi:hypothetical protein
VLAGARSIAAIAEWAADAPQPVRAALGARHYPPGHCTVPAEATIRRMLSRLDPDTVAGAIGAWLADRDRDGPGPATCRRAVAVDGKTLRGARAATPGDGRPMHLLACMDHATRAVLAQRQVGGAPEEVSAFAPLLAGLDLAGVVVTATSLHTTSAQHRQPLVLARHEGSRWVGRTRKPSRLHGDDLRRRRSHGGFESHLTTTPAGYFPQPAQGPEMANASGATATTVGGLLAICWRLGSGRGLRNPFVLVGVTGIEPVTSAV